MTEDAEVTKVLESLVADNENLKHDNAELQNLLTDTREDLRALQEEVEEHRAAVPLAGTYHNSYLKVLWSLICSQLVPRIQLRSNSIQAAFHLRSMINR
jgi:hypothetical protein